MITAVTSPPTGATPARTWVRVAEEGDANVPVQDDPTRSATNARGRGEVPVVQPTTTWPDETAIRGPKPMFWLPGVLKVWLT